MKRFDCWKDDSGEEYITDKFGEFHEIDICMCPGEQIADMLNLLETEKEYWKDKALHKELILEPEAHIDALIDKFDKLVYERDDLKEKLFDSRKNLLLELCKNRDESELDEMIGDLREEIFG